MSQTQESFNPIAALNGHMNAAIDYRILQDQSRRQTAGLKDQMAERAAQDELCDAIATRVQNDSWKGQPVHVAAREALDAIYDEVGDVDGLAGTLATAMLKRLDDNEILREVEGRFAR